MCPGGASGVQWIVKSLRDSVLWASPVAEALRVTCYGIKSGAEKPKLQRLYAIQALVHFATEKAGYVHVQERRLWTLLGIDWWSTVGLSSPVRVTVYQLWF